MAQASLLLGLCWLAIAAPAGGDPTLMSIGGCCEPEADLRLPTVGSAAGAQRATWVKQRCTCLRDGRRATRNATVGAGHYRHFHWALANHTLVRGGDDDALAGRVTFVLTPCRGKAHLFVKPVLLRDGRRLDQLFETEPGSGAPTPTWPFPDNRTGVAEQPADAALRESGGGGGGALPSAVWGLASTEAGAENALTFRVAHAGYLLSVYGETDADFRLAALTHIGRANPLQAASEGPTRARRLSLSASWAAGQLVLRWNTTGASTRDAFQLYMLKSPASGPLRATQRRGICGADLVDLPTGRSSRCVMATPCGVERAAQPVGRALLGSSSKYVGGPLEVTLRDHDIEVEDEVSYFFTVLRTPADYPAGLGGDGIEHAKELYVGLDTSSSYQRVKQAFPTEVVGSIVAGCAGVIWTLCFAIGRMKRKAQLKLYMSYQDAGQVDCNPK